MPEKRNLEMEMAAHLGPSSPTDAPTLSSGSWPVVSATTPETAARELARRESAEAPDRARARTAWSVLSKA